MAKIRIYCRATYERGWHIRANPGRRNCATQKYKNKTEGIETRASVQLHMCAMRPGQPLFQEAAVRTSDVGRSKN